MGRTIQGSASGRAKIFSSPKRPDRLCDAPSPCSVVSGGYNPGVVSRLHLAPSLRMIPVIPLLPGYAVKQLVEALHYKPVGRRFDSRWCNWNFSLAQSFWPHYGPGDDSASNRNEYQEYFLGVKAAGA
jgi:hypothetical protein